MTFSSATTCLILIFLIIMVHCKRNASTSSREYCLVNQLEPFSKEVRSYIRKQDWIVCSINKPLVYSNQTSIWIDRNSRISRKLPNDLSCCYRPFWRTPGNSKNVGKVLDYSVRYGPKCHKFHNSANIYDEYIEVKCYVHDKVVYRDYHAFVVIAKRKAHLKRKFPTQKPSVLIIGVDSMSRANLYRQMPATLKLVKQLGAIELRGHTKIGKDTFPNLLPMLTGATIAKLRSACWKGNKQYFDKCRFIWNEFHNKGYVTAFAEDTSILGLFLRRKKGFRKQPTDIYTQPFLHVNENPHGIGHKKHGLRACSGSRLTLEVLFDFAKKFVLNMTAEDIPYWGYFWGTSLSQYYLNIPPNTDIIYRSLFKTLRKSGVLYNTMVIFMSDHGMRFGPFKKTAVGRFEEKLPFTFVILPEWIKEQYPSVLKTLKQNAFKLTTHYDTRATMLHILHKKSFIGGHPRKGRSVSLLTPISSQRNCVTAKISDDYCMCLKSKTLNITVIGNKLKDSAQFIVAQINKKIKSKEQCAILALEKVHRAILSEKRKASKLRQLTIILETNPGNGVFEAVVQYDESTNKKTVLGDISKINYDEKSSDCIADSLLKVYCYCK